jgi:DNA-directed RNA polymerase specialized sigma24 family protein
VITLRETWKRITQLMESVEALGREVAIVHAIEGLDAEEQSGVLDSLGERVRAPLSRSGT